MTASSVVSVTLCVLRSQIRLAGLAGSFIQFSSRKNWAPRNEIGFANQCCVRELQPDAILRLSTASRYWGPALSQRTRKDGAPDRGAGLGPGRGHFRKQSSSQIA